MSPNSISNKLTNTIKREDSYKSPPTSVSDQSNTGQDDVRGRKPDRDRSATPKVEDDGGEGIDNGGDGSKDRPRKRKRSRKGLEKNFLCPHSGCGKTYSRAEHLYRHQLNHNPKQMYACDIPGCDRTFVRQDLCTRHRERHSTRGSHLQRKDSNLQYMPNGAPPQSTGLPPHEQANAAYRHPENRIPLGNEAANGLGYPPLPDVPGGTQWPNMPPRVGDHGASSSNHSTPMSNDVRSPPSSRTPTTPERGSNLLPVKRSNSGDERYFSDNFDPTRTPRNVSYPPYNSLQRQSSSGSYRPGQQQQQQPPPPPAFTDGRNNRAAMNPPTSAANYRPSHTSNFGGTSVPNAYNYPQPPNNFASDANYLPQPSQASSAYIPPQPYQSIPQASPHAPPMMDTSVTAQGQPMMDSSANTNAYPAMESGYLDTTGSTQGGLPFDMDGQPRSPQVLAEEFTAWLLYDQYPGSSSPGGHRATSMSVGTSAFVEDYGMAVNGQYGMLNDPSNGYMITPKHSMAVTSILDPASVHEVFTESKRKEIIELIETQFNDYAYKDKKPIILSGDRDAEDHVLSLRSLQNYLHSYWYHFHPQMPILHKPTFSADKCPNLLLLVGMICIGASCLNKAQGHENSMATAEFSDFLAWHLRGEIFKHAEFMPPAKLWVFQTLLLLEIYEKMYSDRRLHERAHIHHATTLTLMRRGPSLIGRSAVDSPAPVKDEKSGMVTPAGSTSQTSSSHPDGDKWKTWIESEATRRVAFAAFIIDSLHATMFGHGAIMVAHEMKLALPCDESLWSATSSNELARIESKLQARGAKTITFFEGLKDTLKFKKVWTNSFGRTAIMAGLLSVTWHMNQKDVQIHHLGASRSFGGKDVWRLTLTRAFDQWRKDFDSSVDSDGADIAYPNNRLYEENLFESRTVLHHLAHMAMYVDVVSCQIYAKATRLLGRPTLPSDYEIAQKRICKNWAPRASARHATFSALKFLQQVLLPTSTPGPYYDMSGPNGPRMGPAYSARDDFLLNRPWVLYYATLVVWSYGYAVEGALDDPPALLTAEEQYHDMIAYLNRVGGVEAPGELEHLNGRNRCLGLLYVVRDKFRECRWQLLREAALLLDNCIDMLRTPA